MAPPPWRRALGELLRGSRLLLQPLSLCPYSRTVYHKTRISYVISYEKTPSHFSPSQPPPRDHSTTTRS